MIPEIVERMDVQLIHAFQGLALLATNPWWETGMGTDGPTLGCFAMGSWYLDYNGNRKLDECGIDKCLSFGRRGD